MNMLVCSQITGWDDLEQKLFNWIYVPYTLEVSYCRNEPMARSLEIVWWEWTLCQQESGTFGSMTMPWGLWRFTSIFRFLFTFLQLIRFLFLLSLLFMSTILFFLWWVLSLVAISFGISTTSVLQLQLFLYFDCSKSRFLAWEVSWYLKPWPWCGPSSDVRLWKFPEHETPGLQPSPPTQHSFGQG